MASFSAARLQRFRRLTRARVATGIATPSVAWAAYVPLLPSRLPLSGQVFQVPITQRIRGRRLQVLTAGLMATARAHDVRVHVWTVNDAEQMRELIDLGVDGLIVDRIDLLRAVALERGLWTS